MPYSYYCNYCGKELTQETVLFDMQYLLTRRKERTFNILKFRMTQEELKALIASGEPADNGYRKCKLSFRDVMTFISNKNNLDNPVIAQLTMEKLGEYMEQGFGITAAAARDDDPFGFDDDEELEEEEDLSEEPQVPYVTPACIHAIEEKDEWNKDRTFTKSILRGDFEVLKGIFGERDSISFEIREDNEVDNEGKNVLTGYDLNGRIGGYMNVDARVCPKCGTRVFTHAGTAKHQNVVFAGYVNSGKTSIIIALVNYAVNYMVDGFGSNIWSGSKPIAAVANVEWVGKSMRLEADLDCYNKGIAPGATECSQRTDAYAATLYIKNKADNRNYLLTLTDLSGSMYGFDGEVRGEIVHNTFPTALYCDAYVACFDTQAINRPDASGHSSITKIMNLCSLIEGHQHMRANHNATTNYIPTMVLLTKCKDLEETEAQPQFRTPRLPLERMYYLQREKQAIMENETYCYLHDRILRYGHLNKSYIAMMRCSPYGYRALSMNLVNRGEEYHAPTPKNIDSLMYWILCVTGIIPTETAYTTDPNGCALEQMVSYTLKRPQLRTQNPLRGEELEEAMARCALFENPGYFDREIVACNGNWAHLLSLKTKSRWHPDTNDRE